MDRRDMLRGLGVVGCSLAAHPLTTTMSFAALPGDARLVVLILRGGMDGLDVVRPVNDPDFAALRDQTIARTDPGLPLGAGFEMHPALGDLMPLWQAGQLGFVHAVSTPYRNKRSHFDGQDLLEAGTGMDVGAGAARSGWLNRMLGAVPGVTGDTAYAIGREAPLILKGDAPVANWTPETRLDLSPQSRLLLERMYAGDPAFHAAVAEAVELAQSLGTLAEADSAEEVAENMRDSLRAARQARGVDALAAFAADRLRGDTRIASFSISGWDTHRNQVVGLRRALGNLSDAILTLRDGLGPVWDKTAVLALTEFGRTARENGTGGTDHGTGGVMVMAGGAIRGGRVYGQWPGLAEADLFDRRDLMPTGDVRRYAGWAMRGMYGLDRDVIEKVVFPGLDMGSDPGILA